MDVRAVPPATDNTLLPALAAAGCTALVSALAPVSLAQNTMLFDMNDRIDRLYFPVDAVISMSVPLGDRDTEVAMVGREGFAGASAYLGHLQSPWRITVQHPGTAYTLPVESVQSMMAESPAVSGILNGYVAFLIKMLGQSSFCRSAHSIEQQIARWLLMFSDRIGSPLFSVTHEALGRMLGVRRASVTEIARRLQAQNIIDYRLGRVTITSRDQLEQVVCECYRAMCHDASDGLKS